MPHGEVNDVSASLQHEHTRARGMVRKVRHTACGELEVVGPVGKFSNFEVGDWMAGGDGWMKEGEGVGGEDGEKEEAFLRAPPLLGEHTDEILTRILKCSKEEIASLRVEGVVA